MAHGLTLLNQKKDKIHIDEKVLAEAGYTELQFIGTYRKVAGDMGEPEAIRIYSGMTPDKSAYILTADPRLGTFTVRWSLDSLRKIAENGYRVPEGLEKKKHSASGVNEVHRGTDGLGCYDEDDDYDEFYGPKDTVTYARWLYNRQGDEAVARHFGVSRQFARTLGLSDLPGGMKVAALEGSVDEIYAIEERIEDRHAAAFENTCNLKAFRRTGSRKLKVRMNRLLDIPAMFVLKKLLEAEEFNITAKDCYYKYVDYNYGKKGEKLREAIGRLPETGWHYWWQDDEEGTASYIFYVELPGEVQVSWHGMDTGDMEGVPKVMYREWDGQVASTLPKLVECIGRICPELLAEKFNAKKCREEIAGNIMDKGDSHG